EDSDRMRLLSVALRTDGSAVDSIESRLQQADAHRRRGEWAQAELRFREILERDERRLDARSNLGLALYRQQRLPEAEKEYRGVLRRDARDPAGLAGLALVLAAQHDYGAARDVLRSL